VYIFLHVHQSIPEDSSTAFHIMIIPECSISIEMYYFFAEIP
jgi:hypothetical protein